MASVTIYQTVLLLINQPDIRDLSHQLLCLILEKTRKNSKKLEKTRKKLEKTKLVGFNKF